MSSLSAEEADVLLEAALSLLLSGLAIFSELGGEVGVRLSWLVLLLSELVLSELVLPELLFL